ncbi:MAG: hypothetical protein U9Q12_02780 [Patescibacteria group bacterium]|nr:hypothetical protein [Patescibacteria group bacterium]
MTKLKNSVLLYIVLLFKKILISLLHIGDVAMTNTPENPFGNIAHIWYEHAIENLEQEIKTAKHNASLNTLRELRAKKRQLEEKVTSFHKP